MGDDDKQRQGTILEAIVGDCDACEDFVRKSRELDVRLQTANADKEASEATRFRTRLEQVPPDLSDPRGLSAGKVTIAIDPGNGASGGPTG